MKISRPYCLNAVFFLAAGAALLSPAACAIYRNDKCYIDETEYQIAYSLFLEAGSLDLVKRQLTEFEWRRCKINEAVYRLTKISEVTDEEAPGEK